MLVLASQQQEQECGDGTNFVLVFAGALLENAEQLLRMVKTTVDNALWYCRQFFTLLLKVKKYVKNKDRHYHRCPH